MASAIDLITVSEYYDFLGDVTTTPSPFTQRETTIQLYITKASSYCERYCQRPLQPDSEIPEPTDRYGTVITKYQAYDATDGTSPHDPANPLPDEIKTACFMLVRYYTFKYEKHFGMSSQSDDNRTKTYRATWVHDAEEILKRYKYFKPLSKVASELNESLDEEP